MNYKEFIALPLDKVPLAVCLDGDHYWARRAQEKLISQIDDFDTSISIPPESVEEVLIKAQSFPMMGEKRLVIMREYQKFSDRDKKMLSDYASLASPTTILVFVGSLPKGVGGFTAVDLTADNAMIKDEIADVVKSNGATITDKAISLLCDYCEEDMGKIVSECIKLSAYVGNGSIDEEDVQTCVTPSITYKIYQLGETVASGRYVDSYKMVDMLEIEPTAVLANLTKYYRNVFYAKIYGGNSGDLARYLQIKPYPLTLAAKTAKNYSAVNLYSLIKLFYKLEEDVKTGLTGGDEAMELAIAEAVQKRNI
jgi:DNA polymerase III delta subunit